MTDFDTAELQRRLENVIRIGSIAEVDHDAKKIRIQSGEILSAWLPWPVEMGRNFKRWRPLRVGQQVIIGSASADPAQAVIIGMLYTDALNAPSAEPALDLIRFENGAEISHHLDTGKITVICKGEVDVKASSHITVVSGGNISFTAEGVMSYTASQHNFVGDIFDVGNITATKNTIANLVAYGYADCIGGGVSLNGHKHAGTGAPL